MPVTTYLNPNSQQLFDFAVYRQEGTVASNGALRVLTGKRTGRSPQDRFIVRDALTQTSVDWGTINQPIDPIDFEKLWQDAEHFIKQRDIFAANLLVGAHPQHQLTVNIRCNYAWQTLFCHLLFRVPVTPLHQADWQILNASDFIPNAKEYNLPGEAAIVLEMTHKSIINCVTQYAGEMKKAMFSILNYLLPEADVLPMHCAANVDKEGHVALFFGLSGTGKTTLSADPNRLLIGDDEHGWGVDGVFNFEGGCYAKCIHLSARNEPIIWQALRRPAVMENVVLEPHTKAPNFKCDSITENTRAAYSLEFIETRARADIHPHPQTVIFLTCDLYGVLPPVAKLTAPQIEYYFLSGYTAKVGSTEMGCDKAIQSTFSQCFGAPFFPRHPHVYAQLLTKRIQESGASVYLVNTGWYGGRYGQGGQRYPISVSRQIITSICAGELTSQPYHSLAPFDLMIPTVMPGIDQRLINPRESWSNDAAYEDSAQELLVMFANNYKNKKF